MTDNVITVFGYPKLAAEMPGDSCRGLVLSFRVPGWIIGKTFVLGAGGMFVQTNRVPGIISFQNTLGNFTGRRVCGSIFYSIDQIMNTDTGVTILHSGD